MTNERLMEKYKFRFTTGSTNICYIPETKEEWEELKRYLIEEKRLEDKPETWTFILSQLQGIKQPLLRCNIAELVAHYKRWKIAAVLQAEKLVYIQELQDKLKVHLESQAEAENEGTTPSQAEPGNNVLSGSSDLEGDLPTLPTAKENVVSTPRW